jgi:hypothetical protein
VKIGKHSRVVKGELREIKRAYLQGKTDDEIKEIVRRLVAARQRPLDDATPADDITPPVSEVRKGRGRPRI